MKHKLEKMLPILQSKLPPFTRMLPYLEQVEINRCHSNFGKLFGLFEERMAALLGIPPDQLIMLCNGTLALVAGLMALEIPQGKFCLMPSWTFSATPAAALMAGLKPFFLDVELGTQALSPEKVKKFLEHNYISQDEIGAIMVVSPFGAPISRQSWDDFTKETNIPVIIDAAASFDAVQRLPEMRVGATPMMVSLHATKIFGIGEGGMLVSSNTDLITRVRGWSNFGFANSRISAFVGTNAKMSEYQAAIGLAVLDAWEETRADRLAVTLHYIDMLTKLGLTPWLSQEWLSSTCNVLVPYRAEFIRDQLLACNIESRIWWGKGCHTFPAYQNEAKEIKLPCTDYLSTTMVGLPFSIDTTQETIQLVGEIISYCLSMLNNEERIETANF